MGYRFSDKPPKPEDHLRRFDVRNGAIMRMAFMCYYAHVGHDPRLHDHMGWPGPQHPDDICQMLPGYMHPWINKNKMPVSFEPIDLIEEGYTNAIVSLEDDSYGDDLTAEASIGTDNVIRMKVNANLPTFSDEPIEVRFTLFITKEDPDEATDAVCHGIIVVLPGSPIPQS